MISKEKDIVVENPVKNQVLIFLKKHFVQALCQCKVL